jgi:hypothetical protein
MSAISKSGKRGKSHILLALEDHYEAVGRIVTQNNKPKVYREFSPDDDLIVRLYLFLHNPEELAEKYPDLAPFVIQASTPRDEDEVQDYERQEEEKDDD